MRLALSSILLLFVCVLCHAQEAGYIDTRREPEQLPKFEGGHGYGGGIGCAGCSIHRSLRASIQRLDLLDSGDTSKVEWTLRLKNTTAKTIYVPSSLLWSSVATEEKPGHKRVLTLFLYLSVRCQGESGSNFSLSSPTQLWSSPDGSRGSVQVDPGQWVTIIGQGKACPNPRSNADSYSLHATLDGADYYKEDEKNLQDSLSDSAVSIEQPKPLTWSGMAAYISNDDAPKTNAKP